MSEYEGLTGDEMLDHPQNADLKALVEKRCVYNKCINAYAALLSILVPHLQLENMTPEQREKYVECLKELRDCHCVIDPGIEGMLNEFPQIE